MDIALFAPLMKFHLFHGVDEAPLLARITNVEFVFSCHCSFPGAVAHAKLIYIISLERMCELLHTRRLGTLACVTAGAVNVRGHSVDDMTRKQNKENFPVYEIPD